MRLYKIAKREMREHKQIYIFLLIQSLVIMITLVSIVSVVVSRYDKYRIIESLVGEKGMIMDVQHIVKTGESTGDVCTTVEDVEAVFNKANATCTYSLWMGCLNEKTNEKINPRIISYDNKLAFGQTPQMSKGRWFRKGDNSSEEIEIVINKGTSALKVGDVLKLTTDTGELLQIDVPLRIVGILEDKSEIIGGSVLQARDEKRDFRDCFWLMDNNIEKEQVVLMLNEDLKRVKEQYHLDNTELSGAVSGFVFLDYVEDITKEDEVKNQIMASSPGCFQYYCIYADELHENSKQYIWAQIRQMMPILLGALIMVIISVICTSAITACKQLKNYAIYYTLGLEWKECGKVHMLQLLIVQCEAVILMVVGAIVVKVLAITDSFVVRFGMWQVIAVLVYVLVCILLNGVALYNVIGKQSPKKLLVERS